MDIDDVVVNVVVRTGDGEIGFPAAFCIQRDMELTVLNGDIADLRDLFPVISFEIDREVLDHRSFRDFQFEGVASSEDQYHDETDQKKACSQYP